MDQISISLNEDGRQQVSEVRIDGVIDTRTAGELEQVLDSLVSRDRNRIVVDLAGVDYISSAGWGIFISHIKDVRTKQGDIKLSGMVPNVLEVYELLEFDQVLRAFGSVDDAKSDFGSTSTKPIVAPKPLAATVSVISDVVSPGKSTGGSKLNKLVTADDSAPGNISEALSAVVINDPFATIGEIRKALADKSKEYRLGWWQTAVLLWKNKLFTRRSRFRLARRS